MSRRIAVNLIATVVFAAIFVLGIPPSWWLMEKVFTRDISSEVNAGYPGFAVLIRQEEDSHYAVTRYADLAENEKLVTEINDQDIEPINRDLRASISAEASHYIYFKILNRGKGYTDVQLETPTTGDFWLKNSYRIKGGQAYPLRTMGFGPIFGLIVAILPAFAGALAVIGCKRLMKKQRNAQRQ